jgi:hypothetical protein
MQTKYRRASPNEVKERVVVYLPPRTKRELEGISKNQKIAVSTLIRMAVNDFLLREEETHL